MSIAQRVKDPQDTLDYLVDWSSWLGADTISASVWTVPAGITQVATSNTTTTTTIRLSGGSPNTDYEIVNRITTAAGQVAERAILILVREVEAASRDWTYDPSNLAIGLNAVRFLIGDTIASDPLIETDAEISFALSQKNNDIYLAAAFACRRAAAKLSGEMSVDQGRYGWKLDSQQRAKELLELAVKLEAEAVIQNGITPFAGGISVSDKQAREQDGDRTPPGFGVDTHRTPGTPLSDPLQTENPVNWWGY